MHKHRVRKHMRVVAAIGLLGIGMVGCQWKDQSHTNSNGSEPPPALRNASGTARRLEVIEPSNFTNSVGMPFVTLPAGTFQMGSSSSDKWHDIAETPRHEVRISSPFMMSIYEVTQEQYRAVMKQQPQVHKFDAHLPVTSISWDEAIVFCRELSRIESRCYRLPTEAEWEYACRAGTDTPWFFGETPELLANYAVCPKGSSGRPLSGGSREPNAWGLYDMLGNVSEWVLDKVEFNRSRNGSGSSATEFRLPQYPADTQIDPSGTERGNGRIVRGGSYKVGEYEPEYPEAQFCARACRCAAREGRYHFMGAEDIGFRVVCELDGEGAREQMGVSPPADRPDAED